ncbi:MAG TPA: DUF6691 family protein [Polyangiaceae bacterium]
MRSAVWALISGAIFGIGLCVSQMTDPQKIIGFLDFFGHWDPSLAFVMVAALGVHLPLRIWIERGRRPRYAEKFSVPPKAAVDKNLILGACIFGIGWGAGGYCPGPAIANVASPGGAVIALLGIVLGIVIHEYLVNAPRIPAVETARPSEREVC